MKPLSGWMAVCISLVDVCVCGLSAKEHNVKTLSAMDVLAPTPMKNAVKCDTSCELQNQ
jgi:hypothetical protein